MNYNKNRLQFVHCKTLFASSEEAKAYIKGQLEEIDRPSLYAEPMILKYGNAEHPNILLAIGSVGDGTTISTKNRTFFIDSARIEEDLKELFNEKDVAKEAIVKLQELISHIILSCGLKEDGSYTIATDDAILKNATSLYTADKELSVFVQELAAKSSLVVKNGETVSLNLDKEASGMTLTSEVILAPNKIVNNNVIPNIILHESNGVFTNVDLNYAEKDAQLKLAINGIEKVLQLPLESHIIKGVYDEKIESLVLTFNRDVELKDINDNPIISNKLNIDLGKLINEWTVLGDNSNTPIVLTREKVSTSELLANPDNERELKVWQDILKADVRVASEAQVPENILKKDATGRYLYVNGLASNIKYWKNGAKITVQEALDNVETKISQSVGNIVYKRTDGIFASTDLSYISSENTLVFKTSTKDGTENQTKLKLNSVSFINKAYYDSSTEEIVIQYMNGEGVATDLRIPVRGLLDEWDVNNDNNTVNLVKKRDVTSGADLLSANVNIATGAENILEIRGHALYVNGSASNIKVSGSSSVFDELLNEKNRATAAETAISNNLTSEINRATTAEGNILTKLHEETDRATTAETAIDVKVTINTKAINDEIARAKAEELILDNKVTTETARALSAETILDTKVIANQTAIASEITRATGVETTISNNLATETTRSKSEEARIETKLDGEIALSSQNNTRLTADVKTVTDGLADEVTRATNADATLSANAKATDLALANEVTRATAKEVEINTLATTNATNIASEVARAKDSENAIKGQADTTDLTLKNEITRATDKELLIDAKATNNTTRIDGEIIRATTEEAALRQSILDVKSENSFTTNNTGTIALTKVDSPSGSLLTANVIVSTVDTQNLINSDGQALYASVTLNYDEGTNTLKFKSSDGTDKDIKLNAGSIIDSMTYDNEKEEIVISYTDAHGTKQEVRFSARTLFNEWDVADTHPGAVKLTKTVGVGSLHDKLSAEVIIAAMPSGNLLTNIGGSLYVSNQAKDIILANGDTVEESIKNINKDLEQEILDRTNGDVNLQIQITELSGKTKDYDTAIKALQDKDIVHDTQILGLETRVNDLKANDANQDVKILALEKDNIIIKDEQRIIKEDIVLIKAKDIDQDAAILEAQKDIDNLELKTNISTLETLSVKMEYNSTINSSNIKANTKISNDALNLIVINKASDNIEDLGNGLLFDGSIDYGTF